MNNTINTNELINKLNGMMNRDQNSGEVIIPNGESEQKMFSAGYAEAIADVLYILGN